MLTLAEIRGKGREGLPKKQRTAYITMSMKITIKIMITLSTIKTIKIITTKTMTMYNVLRSQILQNSLENSHGIYSIASVQLIHCYTYK